MPDIPPRAVIFDLGGTLVDWPAWTDEAPVRWAAAYDHLVKTVPSAASVDRDAFARAMVEAEDAHWARVVAEHWSGPPSGLLSFGFRRLGVDPTETMFLAVLDGYAQAVDGWAIVFPDSRETLQRLRAAGYRLGLLSNTWWAAEWHNADLALHGLQDLLHEVVYTSDLPHSKPHPSVFLEVSSRLGVEPSACVMVGDRLVDDVSGSQQVGMRGVWRRNTSPWPKPEHITPTAVIDTLSELPALLRSWGGAPA